jgi:hypothetical protein
MGLELQLVGAYPKTAGLIRRAHQPPQKWLEQAARWFEQNAGDALEGATGYQLGPNTHALGVSLHPASQHVEITAGVGGRVEVSAKTSTTGPGFHAYVCDILKRLGRDLNVSWSEVGDETGYFASGDFAAVEREMFNWLGQVAAAVLEHVDRGYTGLAVSMPTDYSFQHDGAIGSVMGPRSAQWLREVRDNPVRGGDMFPWRQQSTGAAYHRGRAAALMWTEVRWVKPFTDAQGKLLESILTSLEKAHALDSSLDYPWREWAEIATLLGKPVPSHVSSAAAEATGDLVGYRRRDVTARPVGEWSIDVPGCFDATYSTNGDAWQTTDGTSRYVFFSEFILGARKAGPVQSADELVSELAIPGDGNPVRELKHQTDRVIGRAKLFDRSTVSQPKLELTGITAVPGRVALCRIECPPRHLEWAEATWRSVTHPTVEVT